MVSAGHGARLALTVSGGVQDKEEAFLIFPFRATARRANARAAAAAVPHEARVHGWIWAASGRRRHMSTLPPAGDVLLWRGTLKRCPMRPTKTCVYTRDEVVEFVRFKSLEKGYDLSLIHI